MKTDWAAMWEARATVKAKEETAKNALRKGLPIETISDITGLDTKTIKNLEKSKEL